MKKTTSICPGMLILFSVIGAAHRSRCLFYRIFAPSKMLCSCGEKHW